MITPQFGVEQDNDFIYVNIRAPYIKASMIQFEVSDEVFVFSLPPYYLRLRLPGHVIEDERMQSSYDLDNSTVKCKVSKKSPGEYFPDLDMLTKLLATKSQLEDTKAQKVRIQEVESKPNSSPQPQNTPIDDVDFDWEIEQELPAEQASTAKYGFNQQYSDIIGISMHNGNDINELAEPESESEEQRLQLLRSTTKDSFDLEHYWADLYDDEMIKELLHFKFYKDSDDLLEFSGSLKDRVMRLGYREYFLTNAKQTYLGIVPLVFAWAYDYRTNMGDSTVESAWNIGKIAPSLSFLYDGYTSIEPLVIDCTARSLTKPLYRNWELTMQIWKDVLEVMRRGKRELLTAFAKLLEIFESELHQVYRSIIFEDYTIWIQNTSDRVLDSLTNELEKAIGSISPSKIYLPLNQAPTEDASDSDDEDDE